MPEEVLTTEVKVRQDIAGFDKLVADLNTHADCDFLVPVDEIEKMDRPIEDLLAATNRLEGLELDEIPAGKVPDAPKDAGPWTVLKVKETT